MSDQQGEPTGIPSGSRRRLTVLTRPLRPLLGGFVVAIGVLLAAALAATVVSLSTVLVSIFLALFLALGLDPAVRAMERRGMRRPLGIAVVAVAFLMLVAVIVVVLVPTVIRQASAMIAAIPQTVADIEASDWFAALEANLGIDLTAVLHDALGSISGLSSFLAISGGLLRAGAGVIGAVSSGFLVVVLTLYFVAALDAMKRSAAALVPAYSRPRFVELTDEITGSVGGVIAGGIVLSTINATVVFLLQWAIGSSVPLLIALVAFFITLVPLVGSLVFLVVGTVAALLVSPTAAIVFALGYFAYVQVEAYFVTPRVMGRAVSVPAVLVIIGAMVGATLLGLLGALVAIPVTASILIILRKVVVPHQDARTLPPEE